METEMIYKDNVVIKDRPVFMDKVKMLIFVIILGTISAGLLVIINFYTTQRVLKNEELKIKASVLDAFNIKHGKGDIEQVFEDNVKTFAKDSVTFYRSNNNEIAFKFSGPGFWGPISGIIALDFDFKTIKGIQIVRQEETPGLGGRITEKEFLNQFKDKKVLPQLVIVTGGRKSVEENEVDAITGATMTSKALEDLLNKEIQKYKEIVVK